MDPAVQAALSKWPDVPACYGWLGLDRRGQWRLQGETVRHAGLAAFMNRNYASDEQGNWFVQNGPQKVYVALEYTPWIARLESNDRLTMHTGQHADTASSAWLDEEGNLLLATSLGIALMDDRDLPTMLRRICNADGGLASEDDVLQLMSEGKPALSLCIKDRCIPLARIQQTEVAVRFGYVPKPRP